MGEDGKSLGIMDDMVDSFETLSKQKGFKLVHMNVRSLPKKIDQIKLLLADSNLDVITMSETWLNDSVHSGSVALDNYILYRQDRDFKRVSKKRGGGLLTYIRNKHAAESEQWTEMDRASKDIEALWSVIHRPHCKNTVICNVYRPPKGNLEKALDYLGNCFQKVDMVKNDVFVMGDMNVNYKNQLSAEFKKLNFFVKANCMTQVITNTTRNSDKSKSLLDLVLTNSNYIKSVGTLEHYISDHQPIFVIKKKQRDSRPTVEFEGRSYRNYEKDKFGTSLKDMDWREFYRLTDPNKAWDLMIDRITLTIDRMCPMRTFKIKNYRPEWVTPELIELIKDRDYFYKKAKQTNDEDAWNIARHLRNVTNASIRQARKDFVLEELRENKSDYKKFWKTIRTVIPSEKVKANRDILLTHEGRKLPKDEVAQYVNDYFINIGKHPGGGTDIHEDQYSTAQDEDEEGVGEVKWAFREFNEAEVYKMVQSINIYKSSGLSNISSFIVKEAFSILVSQITFLFNLTIKTAVFPQVWKEALVIPIPKTGNLTQVKNFRPISLLPLPGKLLEKLIHSQLSEHLEDTLFFTENQHGFRKNHSTIHSVAQLLNFINTKMDQRLPTLTTFIDFRKAFDCVQHPILLNKLKSMNLDPMVTNWFESYLTGRKQRVLANGTFSSFDAITQGVPQGSVLGPLFYIIYANDVVKMVKHCKVAMYADDTVLYTANKNFTKSVRFMQEDMSSISTWCARNGIRMNVDKTCSMLFGNPKRLKDLPPFEINLEGELVKKVNSYKYLGITLDGQLNFNKHIQRTIASTSLKLKQLRRMRYFLNVKAATLIYKNMILPVIEYGDLFLTGTTVCNRKRLQILQNKGLRCALGKDRDFSVSELHQEAKLLKLKYRRDLHLLSYMFDRAQYHVNLQYRGDSGVKTRSHNKKLLKVRKPNTEKFKKSLTYRGPKKWNALPKELQLLTTRGQFNGRVKSYIEEAAKGVNKELIT